MLFRVIFYCEIIKVAQEEWVTLLIPGVGSLVIWLTIAVNGYDTRGMHLCVITGICSQIGEQFE